MAEPSEDRPPMAIAIEWASRIMTVAMEMVLPGMGGFWLDGKLGTRVIFTMLGFATGMTFAIWHLQRMTRSTATSKSVTKKNTTTQDDNQRSADS